MSEQPNPDEFVAVVDAAATHRGIHFYDWTIISEKVCASPTGAVSFYLTKPLYEGQFIICGTRKAVGELAHRLSFERQNCCSIEEALE